MSVAGDRSHLAFAACKMCCGLSVMALELYYCLIIQIEGVLQAELSISTSYRHILLWKHYCSCCRTSDNSCSSNYCWKNCSHLVATRAVIEAPFAALDAAKRTLFKRNGEQVPITALYVSIAPNTANQTATRVRLDR